MWNSLQVAMQANAAAYRHALQTSVPGECWDFLILTAANEKQAEGYRQELALRDRAVGPAGAFFPAIQHSVVVPDPPGPRIGSGGATLAALRHLFDQHGVRSSDLDHLRILLIHSGGMSQRLPAYSPLGKIFAALPLLRPDGQIATLFDHLYLTLAGLPERLGPGMLVVAGDVFLLFDHRHVSAPAAGVTALSIRVDAEMGRGHGVFVIDPKQRIRKTLQKVSVDAMRSEGAADERDRVLIDTGLLFFDAGITRGLAELKSRGSIDLYEDMTVALAAATEERSYLSGGSRPVRRLLWRKLHGVPFQVQQLEGQFLHLGTTRQFRDSMVGHDQSPAAQLFQQNILARSEWPPAEGARVYHSLLLADGGETGTIARDSVVEHSLLRGAVHVGVGSVISQSAASGPLTLAPQRLLFQVPVQIGESGRRPRARGASPASAAIPPETTSVWFAHVLCGVDDDFKGRLIDQKCRYLNEPIKPWLESKGITAADVWPRIRAGDRGLWNAMLFPATAHRSGVRFAVEVLEAGKLSAAARRKWRASKRYSMAMLLQSADPLALIEHRDVISARLQTASLLEAVSRGDDTPTDALLGRYVTPTAYFAALDSLGEFARPRPSDASVALQQARALWAGAQLLQRPDHPAADRARPQIEPLRIAAFAKVAEASEIGYRSVDIATAPRGKLSPDTEVTASAPVRLDLAGGWSDTPPYCFERGGHVVNVSINLDGRPPVAAIVRTLHEPKLILESHDLGKQVEIDRVDPAAGVDVRDPFALHKVALRMTGLLPEEHSDVSAHLRSLGAGVHVITESRVPKGSGLGTSSILGATLLAALQRVRGSEPSIPDLVEQTLLLEQRLSTGGGWQDQVGGIAPGVKSTITEPGVPQRPMIESLELSDQQYKELEDRLVVYYSGQQRLARDILRRVMGRWLAREPAGVMLTGALKRGAADLRTALLKSRWRAAGREIARYWRIKKELFPGSTTPSIDLLFLETQRDYLAAGLSGAGGGGFAYFLCKDAGQAGRLRDRLTEHAGRPGSLGSVYATQINRDGLMVRSKRLR